MPRRRHPPVPSNPGPKAVAGGELYAYSTRPSTYSAFAASHGGPEFFMGEPGTQIKLDLPADTPLTVHRIEASSPTLVPFNALFHAMAEVKRRFQRMDVLAHDRMARITARGATVLSRGGDPVSKAKYALRTASQAQHSLAGSEIAQGAVVFKFSESGGKPVLEFAYVPTLAKEAKIAVPLIEERLREYANNSEEHASRAHMFNTFLLAFGIVSSAPYFNLANPAQPADSLSDFPFLAQASDLSRMERCPRQSALLMVSALLHDWGKDRAFLEEHMRLHPYRAEGMTAESRAHWASQNERTMDFLSTPGKMADAIGKMRGRFFPSGSESTMPKWLEDFVRKPENHRDILAIIEHHDAHSSDVGELVRAGKLPAELSAVVLMLSALETYEADRRVRLNEDFHGSANSGGTAFAAQWARLFDNAYWAELHRHGVAQLQRRARTGVDRFAFSALAVLNAAAGKTNYWAAAGPPGNEQDLNERAHWFAHYAGIRPLGQKAKA